MFIFVARNRDLLPETAELWQHISRKQNYAPLSSSFLICRARRPELFSVSACRYRNSASLPWPAAATHAAVSVSEPNYSSITRKPYPQAPPFFCGDRVCRACG